MKIVPVVLCFSLVLAMMTLGCTGQAGNAPTREGIPAGEETLLVIGAGSLPGWSLNEMATRAEAIVIGRVSRSFDVQVVPVPKGEGKEPLLGWKFNDYALQIEESVYPESLEVAEIAILIEAGLTPLKDDVRTRSHYDDPEFEVGERVLVFLERVHDQGERAQDQKVPEGFVREQYYQVLVSGRFGKLTPDGDEWKDSRTSTSISRVDLEEAVSKKEQ